jgi:hypothetical protein
MAAVPHSRTGRTINDIFLAIPPAEARELFERVRAEAEAAHIVYEDDDGTNQIVPIMIRPRVLRPEQEAYFHATCLDLNHAIEELAHLYLADERVRAVLPFTDREDRWLRDVLTTVGDQPQTVIARLDANADFADESWASQFDFFETNTVGVGGMYYAPKVSEILMSVVVPALQRIAPELVLAPQHDMRHLLLDQLTIHARTTGRSRLHVAFVQERGLVGGPNEFPFLREFFEVQGIRAVVCDPRDLHVRRDALYASDLPIDVVYRDAEMSMFIEMEDEGAELAGLKHAFLHNQVVSSFAGEFDHKSTFEVLTTPELASHFTLDQQRLFRRHVLWTRMIRDTKTTDPDGEPIDLVPWLRRNKDRLVLKPNRSFGGYGIVVGPHVDLAQWDDALAEALTEDSTEDGGVVAQKYVDVRVQDFPVLGDDGTITLEEFYVVCGFLATAGGVGILGRASKKRVVNVGQNGGLTGMLLLVS